MNERLPFSVLNQREKKGLRIGQCRFMKAHKFDKVVTQHKRDKIIRKKRKKQKFIIELSNSIPCGTHELGGVGSVTKMKVNMLKSDQNRQTYPDGLITPSLLVGEYLNVSRLIKR